MLHAGLLSTLMEPPEPKHATVAVPTAAAGPWPPEHNASFRAAPVQVRALAAKAAAGVQPGAVRTEVELAGNSPSAQGAAGPQAAAQGRSSAASGEATALQAMAPPQVRSVAPSIGPATASSTAPAKGVSSGVEGVTALTPPSLAGGETHSAASGPAAAAPASAVNRASALGTTAQAASLVTSPPAAHTLVARTEPAARGAPGAPGVAAADDEHPPPPVYATRTPPAFRLSYALRRGAMSGQAELTLQRPGNGYALELKGTALGLEVLGLSSRGGFGPQGFMPERFVDRRRGKDRLAANFDHSAGRITYSGTPVAQALLPGAQDRLSWMVQLAAILEAAPARYPAGSRIALSVSGARGDVDIWTFVVQGRQRLELPSGTVPHALRLTREPRRPYDTQVEAWLDPAQHHLPVRARLTVLPGGETLELSLQPS